MKILTNDLLVGLALSVLTLLSQKYNGSKLGSVFVSRPIVYMLLSSLGISSRNIEAANYLSYKNYYVNKYRQTRYKQLRNNCGKRKRNIEHRKCQRQCVTDEDCRGSKRKCLCDGECGLSCIRINTSCSKVDDFPNGMVTYNPDTLFGSSLIYSCYPGYTLLGNNVRACEGDGWWSGESPVCIKEVFCGPPPHKLNSLPNVQMSKEASYKIGTEVEYQCDIGYEPNGQIATIVCGKDQEWSYSQFQCNAISCGKPADIKNGLINANGYLYSNVIEYRCVEGYKLRNGDFLRECTFEGVWSGIEPTCEAINCGDPPFVKNALINYDRTVFGASALYSCVSGNYLLDGPSYLSCDFNGQWNRDTLPRCIERNCSLEYSEYSKPQYKIFPSNQPIKEYTYPVDTKIRILCQQGYELVAGQSHITCMLNGLSTTWSHQPLPTCRKIKYCDILSPPENGQIHSDASPASFHGYLPNTVLKFTCLFGYRLFGSSSLTCNEHGQWKGDIPYCIGETTTVTTKITTTITKASTTALVSSVIVESPANQSPDDNNRGCSSPPQINNGYNKFSSFKHESKVYYQCFSGYSLSEGDRMLQCNNGNWIGRIPICSKINCGFPGSLKNGKIMYIGTLDEYQYKPYMTTVGQNRQIRYECDLSYNLVGPSGSTCINGYWKPAFNQVNCVKDSNIAELIPTTLTENSLYQYSKKIVPDPEFVPEKSIVRYVSHNRNMTSTDLPEPTSQKVLRNKRLRKVRRQRLRKQLRRRQKLRSDEVEFVSKRRRRRPKKTNKKYSERRVFNYWDQQPSNL